MKKALQGCLVKKHTDRQLPFSQVQGREKNSPKFSYCPVPIFFYYQLSNSEKYNHSEKSSYMSDGVQCMYMLSDERLQCSKHIFSDGAQGTQFDSVYENIHYLYWQLYITQIPAHQIINFEVIMHALTWQVGVQCGFITPQQLQEYDPAGFAPPICSGSGSCAKVHGVGAARR